MSDLSFCREITAHEKATIKRSAIRGAPYNPRKIAKKERENLYNVSSTGQIEAA